MRAPRRADTRAARRGGALRPVWPRCCAIGTPPAPRATPPRRPAGAAAAIIVYDITNSDSFARAKSWVRARAGCRVTLSLLRRAPSVGAHRAAQVRELQRQGNASLVMALAGNKADLAEKRKVEVEVRQRCRCLLPN